MLRFFFINNQCHNISTCRSIMAIIGECTKIGDVDINPGEHCFTEMAVTSDQKLLICGYYPCCVSIYNNCNNYAADIALSSRPRCITVVPCTNEKAVVTLPQEKSIQFINIADNILGNKINIGEECLGVTAGNDKIYLGVKDKVLILNIDGSSTGGIIPTVGTNNFNLLYNNINNQLLLKEGGKLWNINLHGQVTNDCNIPGLHGLYGLALNKNGCVYLCRPNAHTIEMLPPDLNGPPQIVSNDDYVNEPRGIAFNNDFTKLFVTNRRGQTVLIYGKP